MESVLHGNTFARIFGWTLSMLGITGNCIVISLNCVRRKRKNHPNQQFNDGLLKARYTPSKISKITLLLFTNLAISDLLTALYLLIILSADAYYDIHHGNYSQFENGTSSPLDLPNQWLKHPFCFIARFIIQLTFHSSIGISLIITTDRFISINYPRSKYKITDRIAKRSLLFFWLISFLNALILLISSTQLGEYNSWRVFVNLCVTADINVIFIRVLSLLSIIWAIIATVIMAFMYLMIFKTVKSARLVLRSQRVVYERKILKVAVIIVIANIISWLPTAVAAVIRFTESPLYLDITYNKVIPILLMCLTMNAAINPLIYIFGSCKYFDRSHKA